LQHTIVFDDASITYRDNPLLGNPRYAFYRYAHGVMSGGVPVKSIPDAKMAELNRMAGISESEARVMRAVSLLEGGFDSVNTYDTGFVSIGFIQFASLSGGANSLGALLKLYRDTFPTDYRNDFKRFGIDVTEAGVLQVLDITTGAELTGGPAAMKIIDDKRLIAVFQRAGLVSDRFNAMQLKAARDLYLPAGDALTVQVGGRALTGRVSDVVRSEAGLAVLMDRKVNTGKLGNITEVLAELAQAVNARTLADLAAYERWVIDALKYRKDYFTDSSLSQPGPTPRNVPSRGAAGRNGRGG
jgi:hypothetical protein